MSLETVFIGWYEYVIAAIWRADICLSQQFIDFNKLKVISARPSVDSLHASTMDWPLSTLHHMQSAATDLQLSAVQAETANNLLNKRIQR